MLLETRAKLRRSLKVSYSPFECGFYCDWPNVEVMLLSTKAMVQEVQVCASAAGTLADGAQSAIPRLAYLGSPDPDS